VEDTEEEDTGEGGEADMEEEEEDTDMEEAEEGEEYLDLDVADPAAFGLGPRLSCLVLESQRQLADADSTPTRLKLRFHDRANPSFSWSLSTFERQVHVQL
jgi:hypothetical protein